MILDTNFTSKSPFTPAFNIKLYSEVFDAELTKRLGEIVLIEEPNILNNTNTRTPEIMDHPVYGKDWLTNRNWGYNLFDYSDKYPELVVFKDWLKQQYIQYASSVGCDTSEPVYIQCWANVIRNDGRHIIPHHHADAHCNAPQEYAHCSGNICIQAENTNTYYQNPVLNKRYIAVKNNPRELIMFPSWMVHWTDPNQSTEPRISIAFDVITETVYKQVVTTTYIPF